jgi:hypothetical protein
MTVIGSIDLSVGWGPSHFQGKRPTCLAFVLSDLNRHANNVVLALSAEYLYRSAAKRMPNWQAGHGLYLAPALEAVAQPGQPTALACPYAADEPAERPPNLPALPIVAASASRLYASPVQAADVDSAKVAAELLSGNPVGLVLKLTESFFKPVMGTIDFSNNVLDGLHHAVVAIGMGLHGTTQEPYIRIRNSWGTGWGDGGNAWLPFNYVDIHAVMAFKV